jgi:hypothetical protein
LVLVVPAQLLARFLEIQEAIAYLRQLLLMVVVVAVMTALALHLQQVVLVVVALVEQTQRARQETLLQRLLHKATMAVMEPTPKVAVVVVALGQLVVIQLFQEVAVVMLGQAVREQVILFQVHL